MSIDSEKWKSKFHCLCWLPQITESSDLLSAALITSKLPGRIKIGSKEVGLKPLISQYFKVARSRAHRRKNPDKRIAATILRHNNRLSNPGNKAQGIRPEINLTKNSPNLGLPGCKHMYELKTHSNYTQ
jgi:hypothetical protein